MKIDKNYDFSGWVTKFDTQCTDGAIIRHNAFEENHETRVPLVWNHTGQSSPSNVLGHMVLHNRKQGVYGYGYFNDNPEALRAKEIVRHGDVVAMSIGANRIKRERGNNITHGNIYEVSLVLAGANPQALIDNVIAHSDENGESIVFYDPNSTVNSKIYYDETIEHEDKNVVDNLVSSMTEDELAATLTYASSLVDGDVPLNEVLDNLTEDDMEKVSSFIIDLMESNNSKVEHSDDYEELEDESADEEYEDEEEDESDDSEEDDEADEEDLEDEYEDYDEDEDEINVDEILDDLSEMDEEDVEELIDELTDEEAETLLEIISSVVDEEDTTDEDIDALSDEAIDSIISFARELTGDNESDPEELIGNLEDDQADELQNYILNKIKENSNMKHNVFASVNNNEEVLEHAQLCQDVLKGIDTYGSLKNSMIAHNVNATIDDFLAGTANYGDTIEHSISTIDDLLTVETFTGAPNLIRPEEPSMVDVILSKAKITPKHTVRKRFADLTTEEARAKGYIKGNQKLEEVFGTYDRVTHPQTIYKKQSIENDDLIDIDWDIVTFVRSEMREMWRYELARAIMIGDGRLVGAQDKIKEDHIRPIASDDVFYTTQVNNVTAANFVENIILSLASDYKGTGDPDLYVDKRLLAQVRLLKATDGHYLWGDKPISETDLADLLGVKKIYKPDFLSGTGKAIAVNLADYEVASPNKGKSQSYEDFDLDINKHKYLLEGRCAGALVQPKAAVVFNAPVVESGE